MLMVNNAAEAEALLRDWQEEAKNTVDAAGGTHRSTSDYVIEISEALGEKRQNEMRVVRDRLEKIKDKFDLEEEHRHPADAGAQQSQDAIAYDEDGDPVHETTEADEISRVIGLYDAALRGF